MNNSILIIIELINGAIHPVSFELIGKAREIAPVGTTVEALVLGPDGADLTTLCDHGCDNVHYMADPAFAIPQEMLFAKNIVSFLQLNKPEAVLVGATHFGRSLAPRIAAALGTGLTADCTALRFNEEGSLVQIRPAFSGNILAHILTSTRPQMATIRHGEFPPADRSFARPARITRVLPAVRHDPSSRVVAQFPEAGSGLADARVVVAGGKGIRRQEDLEMLERLATKLGGVLAVSRALVDAGFASAAVQVGYSGKRVKPDLYIACGISGAPQHVAGMKEAQTVIAINKDPSAPIFQYADIGMVGDLYAVIPKLLSEIAKTEGDSADA